MILFALGSLLMVIALLVVSYPLVVAPVEAYAPEPPPNQAEMERDALLEGLQDLDSAHLAGKLSEADYQWQKANLERDYARVLATLQGMDAPSGAATPKAPSAAPAATE